MAWLAGGGTRSEQFPAGLSLTLNWLGRARRFLWDGRRLWWWRAPVVVVMVVVWRRLYLGHAIDLHVGLTIYSSSLSAKSETKCRRNRIGNFFRNPAYIRRRIPSVRRTALTCSIGTQRLPQVPRQEDVGARPSPPFSPIPTLSSTDILIPDKEQTFTRCRWFAPILSLCPTEPVQGASTPAPPKNWLSRRRSRIPRRMPFAFSAGRLSPTIKVRPPWFHVDRGNEGRGWVMLSGKIQKGKERNNGSDGNVKESGRGGGRSVGCKVDEKDRLPARVVRWRLYSFH